MRIVRFYFTYLLIREPHVFDVCDSRGKFKNIIFSSILTIMLLIYISEQTAPFIILNQYPLLFTYFAAIVYIYLERQTINSTKIYLFPILLTELSGKPFLHLLCRGSIICNRKNTLRWDVFINHHMSEAFHKHGGLS